MKRILVPTDFSDLSKASVFYAAMLARELKSELVILHIIDISNSEMMLMRQRLEDQVIELSKDDAYELIGELKEKLGPDFPVRYEYRLGHPLHKMVENYAGQNGVSLIVIGTHGASGIKRRMMGSNASSLINESSVPVIAVPPDATFSVKKILYATDMENLNQELKILTGFARILNASIHVVHVVTNENAPAPDKQKIREQLSKMDYPKIYFHVLKGTEVAPIIDELGQKSKNHLLAMFTHKFDFFQKLFKRSVTHEIVSQNHIPTLTFNKTTLGENIIM
jgi:nucleotide-binding universal stress UspA family protein